MLDHNTIEKLFERFNDLNVLIIGDVMIDSYLWGNIDRISPEAPVPVVDVVKREKRLGGAANVGKNIRSLGAKCTICTVVGNDQEGTELVELLEKNSISSTGIIKSGNRKTTIKHRVLSGSQQILRVDEETKAKLTFEENNQLLQAILENIDQYNVIILQDYDKGVLGHANIPKIISLANENNIPVVVDPKRKNFSLFKGVSLLKPNFKEISEGLNISIDKSEGAVRDAVDTLKSKLGIENVLLTLSEAGMYVDVNEHQILIPTQVKSVSDVSGAGDTVIAVASLLYALDVDAVTLGTLSNIAGGLVCEELGVVPVNKEKFLQRAIQI